MSENDSEALEQAYGSLIIKKKFTTTYKSLQDRRRYKKLIKHLVTYFQNPRNRSDANSVEITEFKSVGKEFVGKRVSIVDAQTLYIISVKIDIDIKNSCGQLMNGFFIYLSGKNLENYVNLITKVTHAPEPEGRIFWSPWFLFNQHYIINEDMALRFYRSLIVTISEAIRFNTIKNYVANRFHLDQRHNWTCLEYLINNWEHLSRRNDRQVTIPCI
jgi:hypothetical protein